MIAALLRRLALPSPPPRRESTDTFSSMTLVSSRIETDPRSADLIRVETRRDHLSGLVLTRRSPVV